MMFKFIFIFLAYLRQEEIRSIKDSSAWMIATSLISLFSAALLIWILIYIYKQKWVHKQINKNISCMSKKIQSLFGSVKEPKESLCLCVCPSVRHKVL